MEPQPRRLRILRDLGQDEEEDVAPFPERIGRYTLIRKLGRTGTSIVFLARDQELKREVAVKILREDCVLPEYLQRFRREGSVTASLSHPNIIAIHDVGLWQSSKSLTVPYIVMDYVAGGTLAGRRYPPREAARIMAAIAGAIARAHEGGIIHRDLKPGNVLLDARGEPIVADFGLAKSTAADHLQTQPGSILGTPQYMAPEQVQAERGAIDARSDVYALGLILYEMLTGSPPYSDPETLGLFQKILHEKPAPPSKKMADVPPGLDAIVLRALEKKPGDRYATARELEEELHRYLKGEPVRSRSAPVRRLGAGIAALVLLAAGSLLLFRPGPPPARPALVPVAPAEPPRWVGIGGSDRNGGISNNKVARSLSASLALDAEGRPVVAWTRHRTHTTSDIYLRRWDGSSWSELGGSASGGGISAAAPELASTTCSLALDPSGNPVVAWQCGQGDVGQIYLRKWNGREWIELGGSGSGRGVSDQPGLSLVGSVRLDAGGNPAVVWQSAVGAGTQVLFKRWNGSAWVGLDGSDRGAGVSRSAGSGTMASLQLDRAGNPVICWCDTASGISQIYVRRWDGGRWEAYGGSGSGGGISGGSGHAYNPCAMLDQSGNPIVSWDDTSHGVREVHLRRWDGRDWVELGGSASKGGVSRMPVHSTTRSMAVDGKGLPAVCWYAINREGNNSEIYLRRWSGTEWEELGGSGSGLGLSATGGGGSGQSVTIDRSGNPVVAWEDRSSGQFEIYVRRWSGGRR